MLGSEEAVSMGRCANTVTKGQRRLQIEIAQFATHIPHELFQI